MHWVTNENSIAKVAQEYFQNIFATSHPQAWEGAAVLERVQHKVSLEMNQSLSQNRGRSGESSSSDGAIEGPETRWFAVGVLSIFLG